MGQAPGRPRARRPAGGAAQGVGRLLRRGGRVPRAAPALARRRRRRPLLRREVPGRGRVRDHPALLLRRGLPADAGPGERARLRRADHPRDHAGHQPRHPRSDGRVQRVQGPGRPARPAPGRHRRRRQGGRARDRRRLRHRAVRAFARGGGARPALLHAQQRPRDDRALLLARPGHLERQQGAHHRVGGLGAGEAEAGQQVGEPEPPVEPPGAGLRVGGGEHRGPFVAVVGDRQQQRAADARALVRREHVQLGDLEGVVEPRPRLGALLLRRGVPRPGSRRERGGHHVVPPLPALPVEPVAEAGHHPVVDRGQAAEARAGRVPVHDGLSPADQPLGRVHRGSINGDKVADRGPEFPGPKLAVADTHLRKLR